MINIFNAQLWHFVLEISCGGNRGFELDFSELKKKHAREEPLQKRDRVAKLHYMRRAREEFCNIWLYIVRRNSDAFADAIYDRIEESCARLAQHPQLGRAPGDCGPHPRG